jgi:molybdenum cofactor sulfurtransferase
VSFSELREQMLADHGVAVTAIRISVGLASTFRDVYRFLCFLQCFVDRTTADIGHPEFASRECRVVRDSA